LAGVRLIWRKGVNYNFLGVTARAFRAIKELELAFRLVRQLADCYFLFKQKVK
jgi:hypothetical protein